MGGGGMMGSLRWSVQRVWHCREWTPHISSPRGAPGAPGPACAACMEPRPRASGDQDAVQQRPAWAGAGGDGAVGTAGCKEMSGGDGKRGVVGIGEPGEVLGLGGGGDKAEGGGNLGHGGNAVGREGGMLVWGQWGPWGDRDSPAGRDAGLGTIGTPYHKAMPGDDGNRGWWVGGGPNTMGTRWDAGGG